ncbi:MAG: 2,3-bisphosphoglycerate-independent phosphoglycerate mutase [Bacteroidota bacterium]|nr:2,3-bisphosphoglycerate-independent phosphoglycerate mutase [Bacteroidota bacterium]
MTKKSAILIIMDGWGLGKIESSDAIRHAKTPFVSTLYTKYPNSTLVTCGEAVGLPDGQMGNSEVGHLNIGAGRIVYQELQRINVAIRDGSFAKNPILLRAIRKAKSENKKLHLLGLVSDGGVHSHISHLKTIIDCCKSESLSQVFIHAFTDGRDTDPKSGAGFITSLQEHLDYAGTGKICTVSGRYYAMDRDKRWERVKLAYDVLVNGKGGSGTSALEIIEKNYAEGITDEFIKPSAVLDSAGKPLAKISNGDIVICFNFRTDRCREITEVLTQQDIPDQGMKKLYLDYTTMTEYDHHFNDIQVMFETDDLKMTIGEVVAKNMLTQIRIAETEKYPHVTFFFSGGRENQFEGEKRIMIPSPKVATYDLKPEMSANGITDAIIPEINHKTSNFICLNFANADMVGHTGNFQAVIKAVETVDHCVERVATAALANDYIVFITADHGNADFMINADGSPNTAHSLNLVPYFILDNQWHGTVHPGKLADIAPTLLRLMGYDVPPEMTGKLLFD